MSTSNNTPAILQVIPELETGGAEQTAIDVGRAIAANGWLSYVVSEGGRMVGALEASGAAHIQMPVASKNPFKIVLNAFRLANLIKKHGISLIHARSRAPAWSALVAAKLSGISFVTTYHGAYSQNSWLKGLYNSSMTRSDIIIANSHWTANLINSRQKGVDDKIRVVHRGTDFSAFGRDSIPKSRIAALKEQWGVDDSQKVLLNLARLTSWKGQRTLIEALPAVLELFPNIVLVLAGDDQGRSAYRDELEERIDTLGIAENVRLPGHCDDPAGACAAAALVIVASTGPEAFGRAAVEAQALEKPVIVTDIGAVGETVLAPPRIEENQRTGWKIPPGDAKAMAAAVITVLGLDNEAISNITRRARIHVTANFSLETMCNRTLDIYRALLK